MKMTFKSALAATAMTAVAALMVSVPATAGVDVSVGIGVPAPVLVVGPGPGYSPYEGQYYYDPIFVSGFWYHGPHRWKMRNGHRVYFLNGRWHRNEWRNGAMPMAITFRNGGQYRSGRYHGFDGADRINARFNDNRAERRQDRRNDRQEDRRDDKHDDRHDGDQSSN